MITIDKLTLAFKVEDLKPIEERLREIDNENENPELDIADFICNVNETYTFNLTELQEIPLNDIKTPYKYNYRVIVDEVTLGTIQWGCNGTSANYGYLSISNETLYNGNWVLYKQALKDLSLEVHNVSRLDIAFDSTVNPTRRYYDIVRDKTNEIIINGKTVKNRNELLTSPYFLCYGTLNDPLRNQEIHFSTKDKSLTCRTYCKSDEVEESKKNYIIDKFKSLLGDKLERILKTSTKSQPDIYRCEVSLTSKPIYRMILRMIESDETITNMSEGVISFLSKLEDDKILLALHKMYMDRMFRYKQKGKINSLLSYRV